MAIYEYTVEEAFWDRVLVVPGECWLWQGAMDPYGYGLFLTNGSAEWKKRAHRISWLFSGRVLAKHKDLHHKCEVKSCVNPDHLQPMHHSKHMKLHSAQTDKGDEIGN